MDTTSLPTGTVTFLFTDIEGSTQLWEQHPDAMRLALARHDACLRVAIEANDGHVFKALGDAFYAAFPTALHALAAALASQRALQAQPWGEVGSLPVRMALHTGVAEVRGGDFFGPPLNRVARLLTAGHGGQILLSQATSDLVRDALPKDVRLRDLGAHRLKDLQQREHLFQLLHPELPADFPPLRSLEAFAHNLPRQLTSFIGREQEMAEVKQLLSTTSLLTLTGSGGCGKTRLALQVAADVLEEFPDGVWLVELAAVVAPVLVPQTVASALGVREEPGRPVIQTLLDYLRSKALLLVLDNCEHLLSACAHLAESLLRGCPDLRILASSREGLGIVGEQMHRVPSLSLPDSGHLPPPERLHAFEAVQLFVDRARLSQSAFAMTPTNASAVAQVCQRLDGIPLAIELAAARVKALPVEKLAERLDDRFRLLTGGSRTALPRQQTLRALIDWSYDLLSEPERTLLRRLSVFAGGFTLEAAEAICAGEGVEEWEVLDLLTALVEKSLALYEEQRGEARYRLLETVRQYGRDRLLEARGRGDEAAQKRHRDWFLEWAEQAEPRLQGSEQQLWLDRLEREHNNLQAALRWSIDAGDVAAGQRLGGALGWFWWVRGHWTEGRQQIAALLEAGPLDSGRPARTMERAKALGTAGLLTWMQGDYGAARAFLEEQLAIAQSFGDRRGIARSLNLLGWIASDEGNSTKARSFWEESVALFRELGDRLGLASALHSLGGAVRALGDPEAARALHAESLAIFRELGHKDGIAWSLNLLGLVAVQQAEYGAARALLEESLALRRELDNKVGTAGALSCLGQVALGEGDYPQAVALFEESLALGRELGNRGEIAWTLLHLAHALWYRSNAERWAPLFGESLALFRDLGNHQGIAGCLEVAAKIAAAQRQPQRAAGLLGAAEALRATASAPLSPIQRAEFDRHVGAVRAALGEEVFAAAWAAGRGMSLDQAMCVALER